MNSVLRKAEDYERSVTLADSIGFGAYHDPYSHVDAWGRVVPGPYDPRNVNDIQRNMRNRLGYNKRVGHFGPYGYIHGDAVDMNGSYDRYASRCADSWAGGYSRHHIERPPQADDWVYNG